MTKYEKLLIETEKQGVEVMEVDLGTRKKCGKYLSNNKENIIIINSNMSNIEKFEVLSEELGHAKTSYGNILDNKSAKSIKQEKIARRRGYEILVDLIDLINAFNANVHGRYEVANYLNVTEEFLQEAIDYYKEKYGIYKEVGKYLIYFSPCLRVVTRNKLEWIYKPY